jgi:hypothetical protein
MGDKLSLANVRFSNNRPLDHFDAMRINPDRSVTWYMNKSGKRIHEKSLENLDQKRGQYNGFMSRATASKIKRMLKLWMGAITIGLDHAQKTYGNKRRCLYYPRFLTLTLPDKQIESDQEFKRLYLERFIQEIKRGHGVKYYFWKAEPQKNGNIHFHLILDRFIDKHKIQKLWCHIIEPYVQRYQERTGSDQLPPATQIEKIRSFKHLGEYAVKYCLKENAEGVRAIKGRIWGASRELKDLKSLECYHSEVIRHQIEFEMQQVQNYHLEYAAQDEHFTHVVFSKAAWKQMIVARAALTKHMEDLYKRLYNGRTLDYEKRVQKHILSVNYQMHRYNLRNDPVNNVALPVVMPCNFA